jgi:hypothetical protein
MRIIFTIFGFWILGSLPIFADNTSYQKVEQLLLKGFTAEDYTHISLLKDTKSHRKGHSYAVKSTIRRLEIDKEIKKALKNVNLENAKRYFSAEEEYFLILFNGKNPVFALYHDRTYQADGFTLCFVEIVEEKIVVGGRLALMKLTAEEESPKEAFQIFNLKGWGESEIRRKLFALK